MPRLLARQLLGEAMRRVAVRRDAAVALTPMIGLAVLAIEAHMRPGVLSRGHAAVALVHVLPAVPIFAAVQASLGSGQNAPR